MKIIKMFDFIDKFCYQSFSKLHNLCSLEIIKGICYV